MNEEKKVCTWDGKPLFENKETVEIPVKHSNKMSVMFHEEMVTGKHRGEDFRLIRDVGNRGMRLSWGKAQLDIDTRELVTALMDKFDSLRFPKKKKAQKGGQ